MAERIEREIYTNAMIDSDMTLTEYDYDCARTYDIKEILKRWEGVSGIDIEIRRSVPLPADKR